MKLLRVEDIVITNLITLAPATPVADVAASMGDDSQVAALVQSNGKWGYITVNQLGKSGKFAHDIADYTAVIRPATLLSGQLNSTHAELFSGAVLFESDGIIVALSTPGIFFKALINRYCLQQAQMSAVLDTVGESVCVIDETNKVVVWNKSAEKLYGIVADEILGNRIDNFFSNLLVKKAASERLTVKDQYHKPCSGTHVLINAAPILWDGNVAGGVSAERDITEIVNLNQELTHQPQSTVAGN